MKAIVKKEIKQYVNEELEITDCTLLSIDEARKLPPELRGYNRWWWLQSPGYDSYGAAIVLYTGSVYRSGLYVDGDSVAIRPALRIKNLKSSRLEVGDIFIFGEKIFKIITNKLAFCLSDIGNHCFRADWNLKDANDYEKSDAKKFVDDWFNKALHQ